MSRFDRAAELRISPGIYKFFANLKSSDCVVPA